MVQSLANIIMLRRKPSPTLPTTCNTAGCNTQNARDNNNGPTNFEKWTMKYRAPPSATDLRATHRRNVLTVLTAVLTLCFLASVGLHSFVDVANGNSYSQEMKHNAGEDTYRDTLKKQQMAVLDSVVEVEDLALSKFPYLSSVLDNSELVGLYFAASWCPMSTPVTETLSEVFTSDMLGMAKRGVASSEDSEERAQFEIVYVSSDETVDQLEEYIRPEFNWRTIPFETEERTELKRYFQTCAAREKSILSVDRKHEIPTLIIIDGRSHAIISTDAIKDVNSLGIGALEVWQQTMMLIRGMENKYHAVM